MYHHDPDNMNDQPANDAVTIELRELESGKGSEGHKSTSRKGLEEILKDYDEPRHRWNTIFTISSAIAIFIYPLYCYAPVIHDRGYKCWKLDQTLLWTYIGLRSAVDVFYAIDFVKWYKKTFGVFGTRSSQKTVLGSEGEKEEPISWCKKTFGDFWTRSSRKTVIGSEGKKKKHVSWSKRTFGTFWTSSSQKTEALYLILVSLPLPEGLILSSICSGLAIYKWDPSYALIISTPFQYSLRIYHIYVSLRLRRPILNTGMGKWLKAVIDYLPFVLASHIIVLNSNLSKWDELCPMKEGDPKVFDFGIYLHALQSNVTGSTNVVQRMSQSFWWALRNLSSFGSNLQTSLNTMEIILSVLISISGMALFLVYLNARVQESRKILHQFKLKKKTQLLKPDIDLWLYKNDIRSNVLKTAIMENINKLGENKDIDLQNMLSILPVKDKKSIIQLLCLASLKKVPVLENISENILIAICEHLKPVTYTEDSFIVQEGRPLGNMLFIVQGLAWTYTTSNIIDARTLKRGDFYGVEVLTWAFQSPSFSGLPISTRTIMSQGKVEAFAIRAGDLKSVVCKFWWHFRKKVHVSQLELWEHLAASCIQAAWRLRNAKAKPPTKWDTIPCP